MRNFQRVGLISNSDVGRVFEEKAQKVLAGHGLRLEADHNVACGLGAKTKNWAEAMFYFHMVLPDYRKIFVVERSVRHGRDETLLSHFLRTQSHMIPPDVECWELDGDELVAHEVQG